MSHENQTYVDEKTNSDTVQICRAMSHTSGVSWQKNSWDCDEREAFVSLGYLLLLCYTAEPFREIPYCVLTNLNVFLKDNNRKKSFFMDYESSLSPMF